MSSTKRERRRSSKTGPASLEVRERWPLHWLVWEGRDAELEAALKDREVGVSARCVVLLEKEGVFCAV